MDVVRPEPQQKIPVNAQKVFSGINYDAYQWQQKRFDGSVDTWERLKRKKDSAVVLAVTDRGKIIVLDEQQSGTDVFRSIPAGQIEDGEDPQTGAQREFEEETGYRAREWELLSAIQIDGRTDWAVYTFIARGCVKVGEQKLDPGEKISVREVSFDEFLQIVTGPEFRVFHVLKDLLKAALSSQAMADFKKRLGVRD